MYSLVLLTAMTASSDTPNANGLFSNMFSGGNSCSGSSCSGNCYGNYAPRYSCYGGGCSGSSSASNCNGCTGCSGCSGSTSASNNCNGCNGCSGSGFGSRVRKWFDRGNCNGCSGSCNGCTGSGYGCNGSGYGCSGTVGYSCFGASAYSCFGGPAVAYTPVFNGGLSCQGGMAWPAPPPVFESAPGMPGMTPPGMIPYAPPETAPGFNPQNTGFRPSNGDNALVSNGTTGRATVVVRLPIDARLFADAKSLSLTGAERKFVSPELPSGQEFIYRFRVEYERDGETLSVTKKVAVRAGVMLNIEFTDLTAKGTPEKVTPEKSPGGNTAVAATPTSNPGHGTATPPVATPASVPTAGPASVEQPGVGDRATITVKLPAGATLFVDDRKSPSSEPVRRFNTPPLPAGRDYAYLMRAEIVRNGQTETFTQRVPFRAGERVDVDFSGIGR